MMNIKRNLIFLLGLLFLSCNPKVADNDLTKYDKQIDIILSEMTLEKKIEMLHGKYMFSSAGVERLDIADLKYADGPFGIREELEPNSWTPLGWKNDKATFFPTGSALAATWSSELAYEYGTGLAREARFRGKDMILGPAINIQRIPTGGRTYEYLSEDPFLSSRLAVGYTKGVQDNGVAACVKHLALNNQENNRGNVNVIVDERTMHEIYLAPFRATVEEAGAYGMMAAYNKINGYWCAENEELLTGILRDEWGFKGMVVSDWGGTHSTVESIIRGLNVEMPGKQYFGDALLNAVKSGNVPEEVINQRAREILRVRLAVEPIPDENANKEMTSQPEQQKIAYNIASKSIVLLKNDEILPVKLDSKPVIAVIGANAEAAMAQGGVGAGVKTLYEVTPLEGLRNRIGNKAEILYAKGYEVFNISPWLYRGKTKSEIEEIIKERNRQSQILLSEAVEAASKADIVIFIGGNNRIVETEGSDRRTLELPYNQDSLIQKVAEVNSNIVSVLVSGAPNDINIINPLSKALLISWFNGSEGGNALADIIVGNISPSGKLPFTIPVKLADSPAYALNNYHSKHFGPDVFTDLVSQTNRTDDKILQNDQISNNDDIIDPNNANYSEGPLVGYRWYDTKNISVMYPFGHGLTYSNFKYDNLKTDKKTYRRNNIIKVSFDLNNAGNYDCDEVAQAYIHRINPNVDWPEKELKAFSRVTVKANEIKKVNLEIPVKSLQYWNESTHSWDDDLCDIEIWIGASASDIKLKKQVTLY